MESNQRLRWIQGIGVLLFGALVVGGILIVFPQVFMGSLGASEAGSPSLSELGTSAPVSSSPPSAKPIVDNGARKGAQGDATRGADGYWRYVVVSGDAATAVCERFGMNVHEPVIDGVLSQIRHEDGSSLGCWGPLFAGDVVVPLRTLTTQNDHLGCPLDYCTTSRMASAKNG